MKMMISDDALGNVTGGVVGVAEARLAMRGATVVLASHPVADGAVQALRGSEALTEAAAVQLYIAR